jgi:Ca-activated chloride channel family protein
VVLAFVPCFASRAAETVSPSAVLAKLPAHGGWVNLSSGGRAVEPESDRTLAPYLVVVGGDSATERLPLKETSADVSIAGVIARVKVKQLFANEGKRPIEARYVFPASARAAVHGMRMKIGQRVIEAKIDRKQAARRTYEAARQSGRRTSLLEQERANVFTMNVANIMPGDRIAIELDYSELLVPEDATYEFVYPTVVGPRYGGGADPKRDRWIANPYLTEGKPEPYKFDLRAHVETGIALKESTSPSHEVKVNYAGPNRADVTLAAPGGGNRDFVLRYRLAGDQVETGALVWEGAGRDGQRESFFAVMMEPPRRPTRAQIPPREYIFLLDVSGSMAGFPLDTAKELMRNLLGRLRSSDHFDVVLFSGAAATLAPNGSLPATPGNIARAVGYVEQQHGGGGTELMGGLEACYAIPQHALGVARTVVVITDGFVGVEAQAFRFVREHLNDANLFAFGIGSSVKRGLIEGMARAGLGEPFVVTRPDKAAAAADRLRAYIEQPVLTDIHVDFQNVAAAEVAPAHLPDLMAHRPLVVYGKLTGPASGRIVVSGMTGQGRFEQAIALRQADVRPENAPLRWLWARKWVETLDDERHMGGGRPVEEAITQLGLGYSMLTAFTSFVAVDSAVVNQGGAADRVAQPLPRPEGVSNQAVGERAAQSAPRARRLDGPLMLEDDKLDGLRGAATGSGFGGMARAEAPALEVSPMPPPANLAPPPTPAAAEEAKPRPAHKPKAHAASAPPSKPDVAPAAPTLTLISATGLGDTGALLQRLRTLVVANRACLGAGELVLKLSIDGAGQVTSVELVRGSPSALGCLKRRVVGLMTGTRAATQPGVAEVVIRL